MSWKCEHCDIVLKSSSKYAHLKSKRHNQIVHSIPEHSTEECPICIETMNTSQECKKCHQKWCDMCDQHIFKCPFCRIIIPGRQEQAIEQDNQLINWYASSEAFIPSQPTENTRQSYLRFIQNMDEIEHLINRIFNRRR